MRTLHFKEEKLFLLLISLLLPFKIFALSVGASEEALFMGAKKY